MCKYCKHLKELRQKDLDLYKSVRRLCDRNIDRKERLLVESFIWLVCLSVFAKSVSVTDLLDRIIVELEREVI